MLKRRKIVYILGSAIIGIASILLIYFTLMTTGVIQTRRNTLVICSNSTEQVYTGNYVTCEEYEILSGELHTGHEIIMTYTGKLKDVGHVDNTYSLSIVDSEGTDVTERYYLECQYGVITVTKKVISIRSGDSQKLYDGESLSNKSWKLVESSLIKGHRLDVKTIGEITEVGEVDNELVAHVYDENDNDVTSNYQIDIIAGKLEILPTKLVITSGSASKPYDGTPLMSDNYFISSGKLLDGHKLNVKLNGTITEPGTVDNTFEYVIVIDENGFDVTDNYKIEQVYSQLTIFKIELEVCSRDESKPYDGLPFSGDTSNCYLKSGTLLPGHSIIYTKMETLTEVGEKENLFVAKVVDENNNDVTINYNITPINGKLEVTKRVISITTGSDSKTYDGTELVCQEYNIDFGTLVDGHMIECNFLNSIINAGEKNNEVVCSIVDGTGSKVTSNYEVNITAGLLKINKRPITISSESKNKTYDGFELICDKYSIIGTLVSGEEISVTCTGTITDAGETDNTFTYEFISGIEDNYLITISKGILKILPAKLVVYSQTMTKVYDGLPIERGEINSTGLVDGQVINVNYGDDVINATPKEGLPNSFTVSTIENSDGSLVQLSNYTIEPSFGKLIITQRQLTVRSEGASKEYDGEELINENNSYNISQLLDGHSITLICTGSQTIPGVSENTIEVSILDSTGANVADNYSIIKDMGKLEVKVRELEITTGSDRIEYDGEEHFVDSYVVSRGKVVDGHEIKILEVKTKLINVGERDNEISFDVIDSLTSESVAEYYKIILKSGIIKIIKREITITASSNSWTYDGLSHEEHNFSITEGQLVGAQILECSYEGQIINVGNADNKITSVKVLLGQEDLTNNYSIVTVPGKLEIKPLIISITASSSDKYYDGTPLTKDYAFISAGKILDNHILNWVIESSITNVGEEKNTIKSYKIIDENEVDVTSNYKVSELLPGTLKVKPIDIIIAPKDAMKTFDGTELTASECLVVRGTLLDGHEIEATFDGSISYVGTGKSSIATIDIKSGEESVKGNYNITLNTGSLTINKAEITFTSKDFPKEYDGTAVAASDIEISYNEALLPAGYSIEVELLTNAVSAGEYENKFVVEITLEESINYCYDIKYVYGDIIIAKKNITVLSGDGKTKVFDNTDLVDPTYSIISGAFVSGHEMKVINSTKARNVGKYENKLELIVLNGTEDVTNNYKIDVRYGIMEITPYSLIVMTASDEKKEDGTPLTNSDYTLSSNNHPEGYYLVVNVTGTITYAGETKNVANAYFETYDGSTANINNYIIKYELGTLKVTNPVYDLYIAPTPVSKVYDGTPLSAINSVIGFELLASKGMSYEAVISGSRTDIGVGISAIESFVVFDSLGVDITNTLSIKFNTGKITIYLDEVYITTGSDSKVYDGTPLECHDISVSGLASGHTYEVQWKGSQTKVGVSLNDFDIVIYDENHIVITDQYKINKNLGKLSVTSRKLIITLNDLVKVYDGEALTCSMSDCVIDGLTSGHLVKVLNTIGAQTEIGVSFSELDYETLKIVDSVGNDVTHNYSVESNTGLLMVMPAE